MKDICINTSNAFLVTFMPVAMKTSKSIEIEVDISEELYMHMTKEYQDIMKK